MFIFTSKLELSKPSSEGETLFIKIFPISKEFNNFSNKHYFVSTITCHLVLYSIN